MLQYRPQDRMTIAEIKEHPWYNGPMPSKSEVYAEFLKRYEAIHGTAGSGDLPGDCDSNIFTDSKHVHRGEDDVDEESKLPTLERTCKEYTSV